MFGQEEGAALIVALRDRGYARLSLVAKVEGEIIGHIQFSRLPINTDNEVTEALALVSVQVIVVHGGNWIVLSPAGVLTTRFW